MGRVVTPFLLENNEDVSRVAAGYISAASICKLEVVDAFVDSGASTIELTPSMIRALGLRLLGQRGKYTAAGMVRVNVYSSVQLTILGRDTSVRVWEASEGSPVIIGRLPLLDLDLVYSSEQQRLLGNPEHGGRWMSEVYRAFAGRAA